MIRSLSITRGHWFWIVSLQILFNQIKSTLLSRREFVSAQSATAAAERYILQQQQQQQQQQPVHKDMSRKTQTSNAE